MENANSPLPASYRDPSGFLFRKDGVLYRQVNRVFRDDYDFFLQSGLYEKLTEKGWLISHTSIAENLTGNTDWYATIRPEEIPFISYPWEWSFGMLKEAALLTLRLQRESLAAGMSLKDASAYNVQWHQGRMVFIDTLSFERYREEEPWIAYRQYCEQFLAPLLLMHYKKMPLQPLLLAWPEGIPLELAHALLPRRSRFSLHTYLHIHLNARVSANKKTGDPKKLRFSRQKMMNLLTSLETLTGKLQLPDSTSTWSGYYEEATTRENYLQEKKQWISRWLAGLQEVKTAADLGANEGEFSRISATRNIYTIAADFDPNCINRLYASVRKEGLTNIQPLLLDLSHPSPAIGVNNSERDSFLQRCRCDLVMALALIHHLAIGKNIPLEKIAEMFSLLGRKYLLVEFVPKTDEKVQGMLSHKKDIYSEYTQENFENAFARVGRILNRQPLGHSGRVLYLIATGEK